MLTARLRQDPTTNVFVYRQLFVDIPGTLIPSSPLLF